MSKSVSATSAATAPTETVTQPKLHGIRRGIATIVLFAAGVWFMHQLDWNPSWGTVFGTMNDLLVATGIILVAIAVLTIILVGLYSKSNLLKPVSVVLIIAGTAMWPTVVADNGMRILAVLGVLVVFVSLAYLAIKVDLRIAPKWSKNTEAIKAHASYAVYKAKRQANSAQATASVSPDASASQSA